MNKTEFKKHIKKARTITDKKGAELSIIATCTPFFYPFQELGTPNVYLASAQVFRVHNTVKNTNHAVVISYCKEMGIAFWCGDGFLEGGKSYTSAKCDAVVKKAVKGIKDGAKRAELSKCIMDKFAYVPKSDGCHFWATWNKNQVPCKHVAKVIQTFDTGAINRIDELINFYNDGLKEPSAQSSDLSLDEALAHYAFSKHVIVEGDKGSGKTYKSTQFLKSYDTIRFDGNSSVESIDLKGYLIRYADNEGVERTTWQDGALAQAFRQASKGVKTVLFVDEIGRIEGKALDIFVSALTPDCDDNYSFNTGRVIDVIDGVAKTEVLNVPSSHLWVVGTTNAGADYNLAEFESAFQDRFRILRLDSSLEDIKSILKARGLEKSVCGVLLKLYQKLCKLKSQNILTSAPNTRHMVEIAMLAKSDSDMINEARRTMHQWVGKNMSDGRMLDDEVNAVNRVIEDVF